MARFVNFSGSINGPTSFGPFAVGPNVATLSGAFTAGPMPSESQSFAAVLQVDRNDGNGFVDLVGLNAAGGLLPSTKGGTPDTPVTASATEQVPVQKGWKLRGSAAVAGGPIAIAFVGDLA